MSSRREFIPLLGGAVLTSPLALRQAAHAAPPGRSVTIGVIAPLSFPALEGLRRGFRELGYVERRNLQLEYRWADAPYGLNRNACDHVRASSMIRSLSGSGPVWRPEPAGRND